MPKIEVNRAALMRGIGREIDDHELELLLSVAKAELDEPADAEGTMKIELNDTNRPDLWSTAGVARALRTYLAGEPQDYSFLMHRGAQGEAAIAGPAARVVVDASVEAVRPYIVAFVMSGAPIDDDTLKDLIQTQEKLCWNYGRKRRSIAMGLYRADRITYPVHYRAVDPDKRTFVPLGFERPLSLRAICTEHPKGQEYGHIHADAPLFPLLTDNADEVLSFPPVINSAHLGAVKVGDRSLFVELTGTDLDSLLHAASIVACDVADAGYTVQPVTVEYPFDTPYGRTITVPYHFQKPQTAELSTINRLLGLDLSAQDVSAALARMGLEADVADNTVTITVPPYRNDFLHSVDIVEDVMIGHGMERFEPEMPRDFTVGRLTPVEQQSRKLKELMVGLGFQEMIFNYLGSGRDYIEKMYPQDEWDAAFARCVQIANPMSENYEFVRPSILPSLIGAEAVSAHAVYPHHVFEVGKVALRDERDPSGTTTRTVLGFLSADKDAGFNLVNSFISAILYYVGREHTIRECSDGRFLSGRAAEVVVHGAVVGVFGELHPRVLDQWGVQTPCTAAEIDVELLFDAGGSKRS